MQELKELLHVWLTGGQPLWFCTRALLLEPCTLASFQQGTVGGVALEGLRVSAACFA